MTPLVEILHNDSNALLFFWVLLIFGIFKRSSESWMLCPIFCRLSQHSTGEKKKANWGDITRSPKQGYQRLHKKDLCHQKNKGKKFQWKNICQRVNTFYNVVTFMLYISFKSFSRSSQLNVYQSAGTSVILGWTP